MSTKKVVNIQSNAGVKSAVTKTSKVKVEIKPETPKVEVDSMPTPEPIIEKKVEPVVDSKVKKMRVDFRGFAIPVVGFGDAVFLMAGEEVEVIEKRLDGKLLLVRNKSGIECLVPVELFE